MSQTIFDAYVRNQADAQRVALFFAKKLIKKLGLNDAKLIADIESIMDGMTVAQLASFSSGKNTKAAVLIKRKVVEYAVLHSFEFQKMLDTMSDDLINSTVRNTNRYMPRGAKTTPMGKIGFTTNGMTNKEIAKRSGDRLGAETIIKARDAAVEKSPATAFRKSMRRISNGSNVAGLLRKRDTGVLSWADSVAAGAVREGNSQVAVHLEVEYEIWVATLDGRTCVVCANLDGQRFLKGVGIIEPAHQRCRCIRIPETQLKGAKRPVVKHFQPVSQIPKDQRNIGQVDATTTFNQFFKRQPPVWQKEYLGPSRYKLFDEGNMPLDKFTRGADLLNLKELEALNKAVFKEVGLSD